MRYVRRSVEETVNAVSAIAANYAKSVSLSVLLNDIADFLVLLARSHDLDGTRQTLVRDIDELFNLGLDITDEKCLVKIAVKAVMIDRHVDITNITVLERSRVGYTVTAHLVH